MCQNKFRLKTLVFEAIAPLKELSAIDDDVVNSVIEEIQNIEDIDFEFTCKLLIKEADEKNPKSATALLFIAQDICPQKFLGYILQELRSYRVADEKKIYLINILSNFGIQFDPDSISEFLSNPDEAISSETSRFLEAAKADPEAQIDFLDFYFSSSSQDKAELINSVVSDFEGDRLANILSSLVLSVDETSVVLTCLEYMEKLKSLMIVKPLRYLSYYKNAKVTKKAAKILRKLFMQGIYNDDKLEEFYKEILADFDEPIARISTPDGNSNFSIVISRKTKKGAWSVLFIALNIDLGPFSTFGFTSLTEADHNKIVERFFNGSDEIFISKEHAKKILDTLAIRRISLDKKIPYEYFCWERLIDDIKIIDTLLDEILTEGLNIVPIGDIETKVIYKIPHIQNWFFKSSKTNPSMTDFLNKVVELQETDINEIENLISDFSKNEPVVLALKNRLLFLAYCFKLNNRKEFADIFYSLTKSETHFFEFTKHILKRSIYEHALTLRLPKSDKGSIFKKEEEKKPVDVGVLINYIEKNWVE